MKSDRVQTDAAHNIQKPMGIISFERMKHACLQQMKGGRHAGAVVSARACGAEQLLILMQHVCFVHAAVAGGVVLNLHLRLPGNGSEPHSNPV